MKTQSPDTHPEIERLQIEAYRRMTPAERLHKVWELNRFAREMVMADVQRRYPNADERERKLRAASRWLPAELMCAAYGWDPDVEGY